MYENVCMNIYVYAFAWQVSLDEAEGKETIIAANPQAALMSRRSRSCVCVCVCVCV